MIDEVWHTDRKVLVEIVRQIEVDGLDFADCTTVFEKAGIDSATGERSVGRLVRTGRLHGQRTFGGDWTIDSVTQQGLRESGAWPTADQLAERVVSALDDAAEQEQEPQKRSKLRGLATGLGGAGKDVLVEVLASVVTKSAGLG